MTRHTTTMTLHLGEDGIITVTPTDFTGSEELMHAKENFNAMFDIGLENIKGALANLPNHYISTKVTKFYKENVPMVPIALIGDSFFKKMLGNFLLVLASPMRPTKVFSNEEEAKIWLKEKMMEVAA